MATDDGKENIADGLVAGPSFQVPARSPKKSSRKTRSKSIGPGGLGAAETPALKETSGNRRKSAFIPAVKSILSSNDEDEKKRREERRKSLAKRRVSFAPEATLHTWDVVEYLRDATTSSASSEATRRASSVSDATAHTAQTMPPPESDLEEPPSTPPEQVEEPEPEPGSSPANQRDLHQKKNRRRSSGIPPMNFNNPADVYSSSPLSGDERSPDGALASVRDLDHVQLAAEDDSLESNDSQCSARLEAALRQAAAHAGTQRLDLDDDEDMSMVMAEDDITASFKPWAHSKKSPGEDEGNVEPFSPVRAETFIVDEDNDDMSMDLTRAVGRIVAQPEVSSPGSDDMSMELTMPLGSIKSVGAKGSTNRRKSLKRRPSLADASQGSPAKRPASRRASLRQHNASNGSPSSEDQTMELTVAIGSIKTQNSPKNEQDHGKRNGLDTSFGEETMDLTLAVGHIKTARTDAIMQEAEPEDDEDMSMEFTKVVGPGIRRFGALTETPEEATIAANTPASPAKAPTPRLSAKSPGWLMPSEPNAKRLSPPRREELTTPTKSPNRPRSSINLATPEALLQPQQRIEDFEPSPFVRPTSHSASKPTVTLSTPVDPSQEVSEPLADDPIAAPILKRRRSSLSSVHFSPLATTREEPTLKSTALLANNIKLLSTPRKQTLSSPIKRGTTPKTFQTPSKEAPSKQMTPTPRKVIARKSITPKKRVNFGDEPAERNGSADEDADEVVEEVERISLQEFLDLTKIRFMDLSTTKRRHTAAPAAFRDKDVEEKEETLDRYVVAGACTAPEYELYQHACHEMKKYISDGRHFVRTMEANVMEENPLLFSEYLTAPPDQRAIMDNQFKNLKTSARLEARGEWYGWRSTLLRDLKAALLGTLDEFKSDESVLTEQEKLLDVVIPSLTEKREQLDKECKQLQQRHDELNSCDREELEQAREQLVDMDAELEKKRQIIAQLQEELAEKESRIRAAKERKVECLEEIKAAERVREECRGWSTTEVNDLKAKVTELENTHGWCITSASSNMVTMTHLNDLELYFQPSVFGTGVEAANSSISLSYVGDAATPHARPLTTSKRFFLQLIRAHLHCIPQSQTPIVELLSTIRNGWATALAVAEGVRWLEQNYITEESILSDERIAIACNMLLPSLQTKVRVTFNIGVSLGSDTVRTEVDATAELVYGEKYSEEKMSLFLRDFCGSQVKDVQNMTIWADAVVDLAGRLRATGRKGERT